MPKTPTEYRGRAQSYIKHEFLTEYLKVFAFKIFQGRSGTINYVDGLAGPWNVSDADDLSDTSFAKTLNTLETVRSYLGRGGMGGLKFRLCLCEKRYKDFEALKRFAEDNQRFEIAPFHGRFEDNLSGISNVCRDGFTFTFIDPTGWDVDSGPVFEFLRDQNGEVLFNFMSEPINRHATWDKVAKSFARFLADPSWMDEFRSLPGDLPIEARVLHIFKRRLKDSKVARYTPDFQIMRPEQQRLKMRLILGTHSSGGVRVFRDVQEKVDRLQTVVRHETRTEGEDQWPLFPDEVLMDAEQAAHGVGSELNRRGARSEIMRLLVERSPLQYERLAVAIMEAISIRQTQLNQLVMEMRKNAEVQFEIPKGGRKPKADTLIHLPQ